MTAGKVELTVSRRTLFRIAAVAAPASALISVRDALLLLFVALFLTLVLDPFVRVLERRTRFSRGLGIRRAWLRRAPWSARRHPHQARRLLQMRASSGADPGGTTQPARSISKIVSRYVKRG